MKREIALRPALLMAATLFVTSNAAHAALSGLKITEWMYNPSSGTGEYIELTNFGPSSIDMTGWSFDDNTRAAGSQSLSLFGLVQSGESIIFTESTAADFRAAWNLSSTVKVLGGNSNNLGRADEINIYNNLGTLIDRLTYDDAAGSGPRTQGISGNPNSIAAIGANTASAWHLSSVGDIENSIKSVAAGGITGGDIGNPGHTSYAPAVPVPAALPLLMSAIGVLGGFKKLRKNRTA